MRQQSQTDNAPQQIKTDDARQGRWGRQVLMVLIAGLLLACMAWAVAEFYGEAIDPPQPVTEQSG